MATTVREALELIRGFAPDEYEYKKEAASLYHQYGKEEKYIAFLEAHLGKERHMRHWWIVIRDREI